MSKPSVYREQYTPMTNIIPEDCYGVIYKITNIINGRVYVGQSTNIKERFVHHVKCSKYEFKNRRNNTYLYRAMRKYGQENFIFNLLDFAYSREELNLLETEWTEENDCLQPNGYNMQSGSGFNFIKSKDLSKKQSNAQKNRFTRPEEVQKRRELQSPISKMMWLDPNYIKAKGVRRFASIEEMMPICKQYSSQKEFRAKDPSAFQLAWRNNWLPEFKKVWSQHVI